ncbi:MAG TPA: hypothetical protein EYP14_07280, partial [Planctomycetaceae bacterium]|nr:hypothetical protein [Planctomycetaceae bacterium]
MATHRIDRRKLLQSAAVGAAGLVWADSRRAAAHVPSLVKIDQPFHGAVLNRRHGEPVNGGLRIQVTGTAPLRDRVSVNGAPTQRTGTAFRGEVVLRDKETEIVAAAEGSYGRHEHRIRVVWDRNSFPRYRFSIDDNSFFLRDIAGKQYKSLFECFYL